MPAYTTGKCFGESLLKPDLQNDLSNYTVYPIGAIKGTGCYWNDLYRIHKPIFNSPIEIQKTMDEYNAI